MPAVVIPARAGVLSAVGLLTSPRQRDLVRSWPTPAVRTGLDAAQADLARQAQRLVGEGATATTTVDCRYEGQSHEITVGAIEDFHDAHRARNGFARPGALVEVIAIRASATRPAPVAAASLPTIERSGTVGPVAVAERDCSIWVPRGWRAEPGAAGSLLLRRAR